MDSGITTALVVGVDNFVAKKLCRALSDKDLKVLGVGEDGGELLGDNRFELVGDFDEVKERVHYIFDFLDLPKVWKKASVDGAKLMIVSIDKESQWRSIENNLMSTNTDWRIFEAKEVYGVEMDLDKSWVGSAIVAAVLNKTLLLPANNSVRPVQVDDVVEGCLRACFLSGTKGERFVFGGAKIEVEQVGKILAREAKMTKEKISQEGEKVEVEDTLIEDSWQKLRWVPLRAFEDGVMETLQYFFTIADEIGRKKTNTIKTVEHKPYYTVADVAVEVEEAPVEEKKKEKEEVEKIEEIKKIEMPKLTWVKPIKLEKEGKKEEGDEDDEELIEEDEGIKQEVVVTTIEVKAKEKVGEETVKANPVIKKSGVIRGALIGIGLLLVGLMILVGVVGLRMYRVGRSVQTILSLVQKQEWQKASEETTKSLRVVQGMENFMSEWGIGGELAQGLRVADEGFMVVQKAIPAMEQGQVLYEAVLKDKETDIPKTVSELGQKMDDLSAEMGILQARAGGRWYMAPGIWKSKMSQLSSSLKQWREMMQKGRQFLTTLPEFLGTDGKRREWMVLFQNEHEIRPSGGFIGSFGILSFENGKLLNLEVSDVYNADGQLKGHVEPPQPIKDYLGEASWYMRDANWQANFPDAAKDILWFLDKETGRKADGVIGIDLAVAKGLLGVTGEIYLTDFKEKVNKDNLYEQAEFYSEQKFFPGSREKQNFLGALSKQIFEEIKSMPLQKQLELVKVFFDLADRNEIQIATNEKQSMKIMADLGWDGSMYEGGCAKDSCLADYLYIVEANLGVNKANYFLYRNIEQVVEISNSSVARVIKINYQNTAKSSNWPGGDYKNYVRVYVPAEVNLSSISVYDTDNPGTKTILGANEMTVKTVGSKREIGFLLTVGIGKKKTVELRYSSAIDLVKANSFSYLGYIQRQSGYGNTGLVSLVSYPSGWQPMQVEPSASIVTNKLLFNQNFDRDIRMGVEIGR